MNEFVLLTSFDEAVALASGCPIFDQAAWSKFARSRGGVEFDGAFFRRESGRLLATLTRVFGVKHFALVEDVMQESLTAAFEKVSLTLALDLAAQEVPLALVAR